MRISYLREFCVLASVLNFTKAAEQLYITQPALSRHIRALEQEYGVVLIRRTTKNVELTDAGKHLFNSLIPLINEYDKAISSLKNTVVTDTSSLKVGIPELPLDNHLGRVPDVFCSMYPSADLNFYPDEAGRNILNLISGNLDLIMICDVPFPNSNLVAFHDYPANPMIVLCSDRYPVAQNEKVTLAELKEYTFLCHNTSYYSVIWERVALQCRWSGYEPAVRFYDKLGEAIMAVRQGIGIMVLTDHHKVLCSGGVSCIQLDEPSCMIRPSLAYLKSNQNPLIPAFIDVYSAYGNELSEQTTKAE